MKLVEADILAAWGGAAAAAAGEWGAMAAVKGEVP
jgi:hypothetical protein